MNTDRIVAIIPAALKATLNEKLYDANNGWLFTIPLGPAARAKDGVAATVTHYFACWPEHSSDPTRSLRLWEQAVEAKALTTAQARPRTVTTTTAPTGPVTFTLDRPVGEILAKLGLAFAAPEPVPAPKPDPALEAEPLRRQR